MQHLQLYMEKSLSYPIGGDLEVASEVAAEMVKNFKTIETLKDKSINLCCMGSSGAIMASLFFIHLQSVNHVNVVHIKKTGENSHSSDFQNFHNGYSLVMIDDFCESGKTLNYMYKRLCDCYGSTYNDKIKMPVIDCLMIQSFIYHGTNRLRFKPDYIISRNI